MWKNTNEGERPSGAAKCQIEGSLREEKLSTEKINPHTECHELSLVLSPGGNNHPVLECMGGQVFFPVNELPDTFLEHQRLFPVQKQNLNNSKNVTKTNRDNIVAILYIVQSVGHACTKGTERVFRCTCAAYYLKWQNQKPGAVLWGFHIWGIYFSSWGDACGDYPLVTINERVSWALWMKSTPKWPEWGPKWPK